MCHRERDRQTDRQTRTDTERHRQREVLNVITGLDVVLQVFDITRIKHGNQFNLASRQSKREPLEMVGWGRGADCPTHSS